MLNTIGYEGADLEDFIQTLVEADVDTLVDIRERAQSRRKGFSKTALSERLAENGISYIHMRELGDPKEGREAARAGNWGKFRKVFQAVLKTDEAQSAISTITNLSRSQNTCLLCYERDEKTCHRKIVSEIIEKKLKRKTRHLGVGQFEREAA
ncbi:DUF488 domain-containing protein [Parvibaculaceae bacterium PLY_AMNH_Bact1]|nr:DUF488 domain-containing protein [Parvibaculaceae bacterium PLY_AMNH_Bact1]